MSRTRYAALVACLLFVSVQSMDGKENSTKSSESKEAEGVTPSSSPAAFATPNATTAPTVTPTQSTSAAPAATSPVAPTATPVDSSTSAPSTVDAAPVATPVPETPSVKSMEPHKRPVPPGYEAAGELFKQRKFAQAQKEFEKIIQSGEADVNTHLCLAHCFLQQKLYTKAYREFDWLSKYAKNSISLKKSCQATADALRYRLNGICPSSCIKATDGGWYVKDGKRWKNYPGGSNGTYSWSEAHIGERIVYEKGIPVNKGVCPTCEGSGRVDVLKDGAPMPRI